jgi:hypothetical protein
VEPEKVDLIEVESSMGTAVVDEGWGNVDQ